MALIDAVFDFGSTAITAAGDFTSANVFDYAVAKQLFGGPQSVKFKTAIAISAGTGVLSGRSRVVGADNAALSTNAVIIADSGVQTLKDDGATALAIGDVVRSTLIPAGQVPAKRYYGVIYTGGGTTITAAGTTAVVIDDQTNMPGARAAVP